MNGTNKVNSAGRIILGRDANGRLAVQFSVTASDNPAATDVLLNDWVEMTPG